MTRFIVRRLFLALLTMLIISMVIFFVTERAPGNVARNVLGAFVTAEQEQSFLKQLGFERSLPARYVAWLFGTDWQVAQLSGLRLRRITTTLGFQEWWAEDGQGGLAQWELNGADLVTIQRPPDGGALTRAVDNGRWQVDEAGNKSFWGIDNRNRAVHWVIPAGETSATFEPARYIPLQRGLLRGDAGDSLRTRRPVTHTLFRALRNSMILGAFAFVIIVPLALGLGLIAGWNEGRPIDRILSTLALVTTGTPEFATGVILILIFSSWFKILPGATIFTSNEAILTVPKLLFLPVLTLALIELGYVLRITRASFVEVMREPYIQAASLKGISLRQIIWKHALRNALIAPITVLMLHVNWVIGGIVVVEAIFGFPGLGKFLLEAALFKDVFAIEAGAMLMILLAMSSQFLADFFYTFLNPRIRYA